MDHKTEIENWHRGFYEVTVLTVTDLSSNVQTVTYVAEAKAHGNAFLRSPIHRMATLVNGKMVTDSQL